MVSTMSDQDRQTDPGVADLDVEDQASRAEIEAELLSDGMEARRTIKILTAVIQTRSHDSDPSGRVQLAFDLMQIAAAETISRICRAVGDRYTV